ncbi:hypothetical protein B4065_2850 [Caldibacillus thermoamylovorans]|nr:hypothetical protein B4065_2850 [Caldibacillus thermoamylovorans]
MTQRKFEEAFSQVFQLNKNGIGAITNQKYFGFSANFHFPWFGAPLIYQSPFVREI